MMVSLIYGEKIHGNKELGYGDEPLVKILGPKVL